MSPYLKLLVRLVWAQKIQVPKQMAKGRAQKVRYIRLTDVLADPPDFVLRNATAVVKAPQNTLGTKRERRTNYK